MDLSVQINQADLAHFSAVLAAMPNACERAARRAVLRTAKKLKTQTGRFINEYQALRITRAVMRSRLRLYRKGEMSQKVWLGMNAIAVQRLGKATQQRGGVQVGSQYYPKAFMIKKLGQAVYIRHGRGKWDFGYLTIDISAEAQEALMRAYQQADEWLMDILDHEIEFELSKV